MALEQGMQQGRVSPTTPQGGPTVAAQLAQAAQAPMQQPAMQGAIQQAGIAAQIQAMKQQQMQQALQQLAAQQVQQQPMDMGIAAAPGAQSVRMAGGGIVGYAEPGEVSEEEIARRMWREAEAKKRLFGGQDLSAGYQKVFGTSGASAEVPEGRPTPKTDERLGKVIGSENIADIGRAEMAAERARNMALVNQEAAAKPSSGSSAVAQMVGSRPDLVDQLMGKERAVYANINTATPTGEEISARTARDYQAHRQFLISRGIDPDAYDKRVAEDRELFKKQQDLIQSRIDRERGQDTPMARAAEALMGFRQMRGQGIGTGIASSAGALTQGIKTRQKAIGEQEDLQLRVADLEMTRRRALEDAKQAIAEGRWNDAKASLGTERAASNEKAKLLGETFGKEATLALKQREIDEVKAARLGASKQHAEQMEFNKNMGLLNSMRDKVNQIALKIGQKYEKNPVMMMYNAQAMTGSVDPKIQEQYENVIAMRDKEIADATEQQARAAKFLEDKLYGRQPIFGINAKGDRIVSFDDKKTWQPVVK